MIVLGVDLCPIITPKHPGASTCTVPLYRAYLSGKGGHTSLQSMKNTENYEHTDVIKEGDLFPGDCVSTDQYECQVKGRLPHKIVKKTPHECTVVVQYLLTMHRQ